jgi:hypothetical protein
MALLTAKVDRLARSVAFIANLMDAGVNVVAVDQVFASRQTPTFSATLRRTRLVASSSGPLCLSHVARLRCEGSLYRLLGRFDLGFPVDVRGRQVQGEVQSGFGSLQKVRLLGFRNRLAHQTLIPKNYAWRGCSRKLRKSIEYGRFQSPLLGAPGVLHQPLIQGQFCKVRPASSLISLTQNASENRSVGGSIPPLGTIPLNARQLERY